MATNTGYYNIYDDLIPKKDVAECLNIILKKGNKLSFKDLAKISSKLEIKISGPKLT